MEFNFDVVGILLLVITLLNLSLGIFVLLTKRQSQVNQYFFVFLISATSWCVSMFFFRGLASGDLAVLLARVLYMSAATIPLSLIYFIRVFPKEEHNLPWAINLLLPVPLIVVAFISLAPGLLINNAFLPTVGEPIIDFNQNFHLVYGIYIISYFSICYTLLFIKYLKFEGVEKEQIRYVFIGTLVATMIGVTTNLTMPFLGDFRLNWLGQVGIITMIGSFSYAIVKHRLFNLKIVATEFLVFVLCSSLFIRVLLSSSYSDFVINVAFLGVMIIIGIFLVRSVIREIKQKEQVEVLAKGLKAANQNQSSLIHFMNHQIKGRFGSAKNIFAELLTDDYGKLPEAAIPLLEKGLEEVNMGVDYVQGILKGASAESGTLPYDMKQLDLKTIVENVASKQREYAEKKGLSFSVDIKPGSYTLLGDSVQLGEAIRNLIDNSINYTLKGSIKISLSSTENRIHFEVKDTGVGISKDDKEKLFKAGGRGIDSLKVNTNSTGYGLVFVKNVIEAHKGRVWVESEGCEKGSQFYIELPTTISTENK